MSHPCKKEETGVCCGGCTKYKDQEEKTIPDANISTQQPKEQKAEQPNWKYQYTMQG
jgi:hypothetical protein